MTDQGIDGWRDCTIELTSLDMNGNPSATVLCRADGDCMWNTAENMDWEEGRYLTLGEAVDAWEKHYADLHARKYE